MTRMRYALASAGVVLAASALAAGGWAVAPAVDPVELTAHEWGTFTSIAGADGEAQAWRPLSGADDLPCFVHRARFGVKPDLSGTVRMETPVVYFYAPRQLTVDVTVRFRQGLVTEWYPRADVRPAAVDAPGLLNRRNLESRIAWTGVTVSPGADASLPREEGASHYYAARDTDAAVVRAGTQHEKFLFYRGVGRFAPPLVAVVDGGGAVTVHSRIGEALGTVIFFERRGGTAGYRVARSGGHGLVVAAPQPSADAVPALERELEKLLTAHGLFAREAAAMIATWRDSWFEEGARLFYLAPRSTVDAILPLEISPRPSAVARVFVGRMELMTPRTLADVRRAVGEGDHAALQPYARFLDPLFARLLADAPETDRTSLQRAIQRLYSPSSRWLPAAAACQ